ncbi:MAG: HEAT repeat domain-containing protein [Gammaproteobacteria bacterium]|nr:HEAT repeat domain-containing protein [Gammaproteobacteria bacterium]MBU1656329.1 HEAT repeat domain-containing protein [Gammaproteobacteria bacterium]MBU1959894.1 HEAT repeat domain-containing protein [Gammaproteobacteria bacterium]
MPDGTDALLLVATGCPQCPAMIDHLTQLVKQGKLGRLEIVNVGLHAEVAEAHGVRSVPWCQIGEFRLEGVRSPSELADWADHTANNSGQSQYIAYLVEQRRLPEARRRIRERPSTLTEIIPLLGDTRVPMALRIGIGALVEDLEGDDALQYAVAPLAQLISSGEPQVRADACHYLGICGDASSRPLVESLLDDDNPEVSEIAAETLALFRPEE